MACNGNFISIQVGTRFTDRLAVLTFTGSYVQFGTPANAIGEALDLTLFTNTLGIDGAKNFSNPVTAVYSMTSTGGNYFEIIPSTAAGNPNKLYRIKVFTAAGAELAAGAYPASLTAPQVPVLVDIQTKTGA